MALLLVGRRLLARVECAIHCLKAGWQLVHEGDVVAARGVGHRQPHAHTRAPAHAVALRRGNDVGGVVHVGVGALDEEAAVARLGARVARRIVEAEAVVEPARRPALLNAELARGAATSLLVCHDGRHGHEELVAVCRVALVGGLAGEIVVQPETRSEVWRRALECAEVALERDQGLAVLLRAAPLARHAVRQQALHRLHHQRVGRRRLKEGLQDHCVGAAVRGEEEELGAFRRLRRAVAGDELRSLRRDGRAVAEELQDRRALLSLSAQHRQEPAQRFEGQLLHLAPGQQLEGCGNGGVLLAEGAQHEAGHGSQRFPAGAAQRGVLLGERPQIAHETVTHARRNGNGPARGRLGDGGGQHPRDVHRHVRRVDGVGARPIAEGAVRPLARGELGQRLGEQVLHLGAGRRLGHLEGVQNIAQREDGETARGQLLGAVEAIAVEVEEGVGQALQRSGAQGDRDAAELRVDVGRRQHRLHCRSLAV
mmetsp:Transcript_12922/g.51590  ORF Transcript_12922/g.51590 Transcript_12922/m.51590 type:complete len:483 (+) Transcript_12922:331-1779(+)